MTSWRSDDEVAELVTLFAGLQGSPALSGSIEVMVSGGADGDLMIHVDFADGRIVGAGTGAGEAPDASLTLSEADARAVATGDLDLSVAFMQGRLKIAGDMAPVLGLLALSATDEAKAGLAQVAERIT